MEAAYEKIIGPINPANPSKSFGLNIWVMKWLGIWPPETDSYGIQKMYSIYSKFLRVFFLYIYVATQILFFFYIEDLTGVAEGFITFLTQLTLCYKLENFRRKRQRIQKVMRILNGPGFQPKNVEEKECIKTAMKHCFMFSFWFLSILQPTVVVWMFEPYLQGVRRFPIAARFPFNTDSDLVFGFSFAYQIIGLYLNAAINIATDGVGSGLIAHLNGQVKRLGLQLEKIGHDKPNQDDIEEDGIASRVVALGAKSGDYYAEWVQCIKFHKCILSLSEEIEDIFRKPVFAQFVCTCIILCMNCFLIVTKVQETATLFKNISFLSGVLTQIILFCWIGSELIYSSRRLSSQAYFSNIHKFDRATVQVMLIFMERTYKDIIIEAGSLFRIALNLPTFMAILNSSYSYLNLMRKMENK